MRIIAGRFRGRTLVAPNGLETRPTAALARGALFEILRHRIEARGRPTDQKHLCSRASECARRRATHRATPAIDDGRASL